MQLTSSLRINNKRNTIPRNSVLKCHQEKGVKTCFAAAAAKSLQLCPTLCDPIDGSPQGSAFPGILQARTLEWVAISFSITPPRMAEIKKSDYSMCW